MPDSEQFSWESLLRADLEAFQRDERKRISVDQDELEAIIGDFSKLIYATDRRYSDTADRLSYEHRERFRQDLISMNDIRMRLNSVLRNAR